MEKRNYQRRDPKNNPADIPINGYLDRMESDDVQTLGYLYLKKGKDIIFSCVTLELPDRNNAPNVSRIPNGSYRVVKRVSPKYGEHFLVEGVAKRSFILVHSGNFYYDTQGCILLGTDHIDINGDGHKDVVGSKATVRKLYQTVNSFRLTVRNRNKNE